MRDVDISLYCLFISTSFMCMYATPCIKISFFSLARTGCRVEQQNSPFLSSLMSLVCSLISLSAAFFFFSFVLISSEGEESTRCVPFLFTPPTPLAQEHHRHRFFSNGAMVGENEISGTSFWIGCDQLSHFLTTLISYERKASFYHHWQQATVCLRLTTTVTNTVTRRFPVVQKHDVYIKDSLQKIKE